MKLFKSRGIKCVEDVRDKTYVEIEDFAKEIQKKLDMNFDDFSEYKELKAENEKLKEKIALLRGQNETLSNILYKPEEVAKLKEKVKATEEENAKLHGYLEKCVTLIQEKVEDLQSDRYLKVELKPDKRKSNQKIGTKSATRSSKRSAIAKANATDTEVEDGNN